jgi:diphthamide biosynthesis enzyme Dph1/Dph2-like protein
LKGIKLIPFSLLKVFKLILQLILAMDCLETYDLELDKVAAEIKKLKIKLVCIQLPDGLKPYANEIVDELKKKINDSKTQIYVWAGSNFGACDLPIQLKDLGFDMIINFGHAPFKK